MKYAVLMAFALVLGCCTSTDGYQDNGVVTSVDDDPFQSDPNLERNREATVRIRNRNSMGSGTIFLKRGGKYFILTNSHVAGRKGNTVTFQMWWRGYISKSMNGTVVYSVLVDRAYRDIAIIEVDESQFDGYTPPVIPLAPADYVADYQRFYSFGCGAGSWVTNWEGHAVRHSTNGGDTIEFYPQPAGGRSGSSIFSHDGKYIIALIAWRSDGGEHNLDGGGEGRGHGIAMTVTEVRLALSGDRPTQSDLLQDEFPRPLILPPYPNAPQLLKRNEGPRLFNNRPDLRKLPQLLRPNSGADKILDGTQLKINNPHPETFLRSQDRMFPNVPQRREGPMSQPPGPRGQPPQDRQQHRWLDPAPQPKLNKPQPLVQPPLNIEPEEEIEGTPQVKSQGLVSLVWQWGGWGGILLLLLMLGGWLPKIATGAVWVLSKTHTQQMVDLVCFEYEDEEDEEEDA